MKKDENNIYKEICMGLKKLRRYKMLSQQQVAGELGIDRSTYAYYESGRTIPGFDTMDKILKIFDINYYDLFSLVNDTSPLQTQKS